jgi:tetratricopeptide (TPR) repeat protein
MTLNAGVFLPPPSSREMRGTSPSNYAVEQHFRSAEEAVRRGEYERAAAEFTYCIQLDPSRIAAFARRGDVWRILGRSESAVADYSAYLDIEPTDATVLNNRGQLYAIAGQHRLAAADFTAALATKPDDPTALLGRGQALTRLGDHERALPDFTRTIELSPGSAFAYLERGTAYLQTGDTATAIADLSRAAQLNPFLGLALARRADAHVRTSQYDRAISDLSEALRLDPMNAGLYAARGEVPGRIGTPASLADFDEAVRIAPAEPQWRARRGMSCLVGEQPEQAEQDLSDALVISPENALWLKARGEARVRLVKLDLAMADYVEASRINPTDGAAFLGQAVVYVTRGDYGMALPYLDRALGFAPELAEAHYQRARCNHKLEQLEDAIEDVTRSLDLEPGAVLPRRLRAELFLRVGKAEDAYADLAQLVSRAPSDPIVFHIRGKLEFRRNRLEAAVADLTTSLKLNPKFTEALADRAGVFRALAKHREALADLTSAVHQDPKYAAEYLVQLGIVRGATGEFNGAIADFIVALQLDPTNKGAVRGKELVTQLRDAHGSPDADSVEREFERKADADRTLNGGTTRPRVWRSPVQPERMPMPAPERERDRAERPERSPPSTSLMLRGSGPRPMVGIVLEPEPEVELTAEAPDGSTDFEVGGGFGEMSDPEDVMLDIEPTPDDDDAITVEAKARPAAERPRSTTHRPAKPRRPAPAAPAAKPAKPARAEMPRALVEEAAPDRAAEDRRRAAELAATAARAEELRKKNAEEEKKRKAEAAKRGRRGDDDDERKGMIGRFRDWSNTKRGQQILIPLGFLCISYLVYDQFFSGPSIERAVAQGMNSDYPVDPKNVFTAEQLWNEYGKDNALASKKYTEVFVEVSGKIRKVVPDKNLIVLETPSATSGIACLCISKEQVDGLQTGQDVTIQGEGSGRGKVTDDIRLGSCKVRKRPEK